MKFLSNGTLYLDRQEEAAMKSILVVALLGAFVFAAARADETVTVSVSTSDDDDSAKGVAGFPTCSITGFDWQDKVKKIVDTFNEYATSTSAYTVQQAGRFMEITGEIIVVTANGDTQLFEKILIDRYGRIKTEAGEFIEGAKGFLGGEKQRLDDLSDTAFKKITTAFKKGEAFLSSLPNDIWVFGKTSFADGATIAADTAKMITQKADDVWTNMVPLSDANKGDIEKLMKSGIDLAIEPAKIMYKGAGAGFNAMKDFMGVATGVPVAVGGSVIRTGADMVTTGAGMFGRMAEGMVGMGNNLAGFNKQKRAAAA